MKSVIRFYRVTKRVYPVLFGAGAILGLASTLYYLNPVFLMPIGFKIIYSAVNNENTASGNWLV